MEQKLEKPVMVAICTSATDADGQQEGEMRMLVAGTLTQQQEGVYLLRYTERTEQEDGSALTADVRLKLENGHVIMLRKGLYGATMVFSRGQRYEGTYHTPYGDLDMAIYTTKLLTDLRPDAGAVTLDYQLDMNGGFASMRHMKLQYGVEVAK